MLLYIHVLLDNVIQPAANWLLDLLEVMDEMKSTVDIKFTTEDTTAFQSQKLQRIVVPIVTEASKHSFSTMVKSFQHNQWLATSL